ncbi:DUF1990 domain-containing protein [Streptomyces sp. NPDC051940]|uniref:DUF1990 family protein n=1 Tax=Streptomyces sp. NPDC051940 TaxID=3155675 RepID=UPI003424BC43
MPVLTYPEAGATRNPTLPSGYRHLSHTARLGEGEAVFTAAAEAVLSWEMHRHLIGVRIQADGPRAVRGAHVEVTLGAGPLRITAPCEVVWTVDDEHRAGFAYGTLPGHPERGEEAFVVTLAEDGGVTLTVRAFSRPAARFARAAGPLVPVFQHAYARGLGRTLRRLAAAR